MKAVAQMINDQDPIVHSDPTLSMLMLAEVQSHVPELVDAAPSLSVPSILVLVILTWSHLLLAS